jgi:hypothetical protein
LPFTGERNNHESQSGQAKQLTDTQPWHTGFCPFASDSGHLFQLVTNEFIYFDDPELVMTTSPSVRSRENIKYYFTTLSNHIPAMVAFHAIDYQIGELIHSSSPP